MEVKDQGYDKWLGRSLSEVPQAERIQVIEFVLGATISEVAKYLTITAMFELGKLDPAASHSYEDVSQEVHISLFENGLPSQRLTAWRAYLLQRTRWKIGEMRRQRHRQRNDERITSSLDDERHGDFASGGGEFTDRLVTRDRLDRALARIDDDMERAVLMHTFVLDEGGYEVRTTSEVAKRMSIHVSKVKKLRAVATRKLRALLQEDSE